MRKFLKFIFLLTVMTFAILISNTVSEASSSDLYLNSLYFYATLNYDGSMDVTEILNIDIEDTTKEQYENTVCFIEAVNSEGDECSDIIIGGANGIEMFEGSNNKYCIIHELKTNKVNNIKLIVQSDIEQTCTIKLKPLNYDQYEVNNTQWTPSTVYFKDVPNIKISIEGISDLAYSNDDDSKFSLYYHIENKSDTDGQNVKFKIKEPSYFKKIAFDKEIDNNNYTLQHYLTDENLTETSPWFNDNSRVITFPVLPAHSKIYTLRLDYQATKNGIYDFIINTLDYADDFDDVKRLFSNIQ